jgi:hypothetical protein
MGFLQLNLDEKSLLNNMSKNVVFVGHPNLKASKLNKSLLLEVEKHPEILVRDVYKLYGDLTFNGHVNPEEDQKIIEGAERIILQFPFHWYTAPVLLKSRKHLSEHTDESLFALMQSPKTIFEV